MGNCISRSESADSDIELHRRTAAPARLSANEQTDEGSLRYQSTSGNRDKGKGKASHRSSIPPLEAFEMNNPGVLRTYATLPSPSTSLSPRVLLTSSPSTIAIFDAYPKAKYHFLVLPRYPFPPQSDPDSGKSIVQLNHLDDLRSLLTKTGREAREQVISQLAETAREVEEMIRDEMVKSEGVEWKIDVGFHAIPSLKLVTSCLSFPSSGCEDP